MRKWFLIGGAGAVVGYAAVHFAFSGTPVPAEAETPPAVAAAPAEPVVLAQVVEVTDLDPLLDPPAGAAAGEPFDAAEPLAPARAVPPGVAPLPIPTAD